jgi:pyruvate/2-oxoglutarate dehydrogenase complex dihydrolipoamide dehydrogenase (E3) component
MSQKDMKMKTRDLVINGRRFVIATGSQPFIPPIEGLEGIKANHE